jgi:hypothetical protein
MFNKKIICVEQEIADLCSSIIDDLKSNDLKDKERGFKKAIAGIEGRLHLFPDGTPDLYSSLIYRSLKDIRPRVILAVFDDIIIAFNILKNDFAHYHSDVLMEIPHSLKNKHLIVRTTTHFTIIEVMKNVQELNFGKILVDEKFFNKKSIPQFVLRKSSNFRQNLQKSRNCNIYPLNVKYLLKRVFNLRFLAKKNC